MKTKLKTKKWRNKKSKLKLKKRKQKIIQMMIQKP